MEREKVCVKARQRSKKTKKGRGLVSYTLTYVVE